MIHINGKAKSELTKVQAKDVQPNATDLRVHKIFKISDKIFTIDEDHKDHRGSSTVLVDEDGYWSLPAGSYEIVMENNIKVAHGEAGFVITRSTLNRNDVFLTSGLYDSGYNGAMAACMHVGTAGMRIKPGTRVGQYLAFQAETLSMYDGDYGVNKEHDKKYV